MYGSFCYFQLRCITGPAFRRSHFTALPNDCISWRIRSPMCQTPWKGWEFIQGPGLCLVYALCKGSMLLRGFLRSLNHSRLIGFYTGMSRSCFLPLFIWTHADNSPGIFQTARSLLRFLQTSPSRQTESIKEGNNNPTGFVMVTSYLRHISIQHGGLQRENRLPQG